MYDIRQFRPMVYLLICWGITGFALVAEAPLVWLLAMAAIGFNAWQVKRGTFRPIPSWLANIVTITCMVWVALQWYSTNETPIFLIAQFLVLLQIVKLYEQRANRDYAQMLILSLLLMVSAAINTASLLFAVIFIGYLFLALYVCLLFHLKSETDNARKSFAIEPERLSPGVLRQSQVHLNRSMRRLTVSVSAFAITIAIAVFLFFPRRSGEGVLGLMFQPDRSLTGFSDRVSFNQVARITENNESVAYIEWFIDGDKIDDGRVIYLRGNVLDSYHGIDETDGMPWEWSRQRAGRPRKYDLTQGHYVGLRGDAGGAKHRLKVHLQPTGSRTLFGVPGPVGLRSNRQLLIDAFDDGVIQLRDRPVTEAIQYELFATGQLGAEPLSNRIRAFEATNMMTGGALVRPTLGRDPRLQQLAQQIVPDIDTTPPSKIASAVESWFISSFEYTLDLTSADRGEEQDPLMWFIYDVKRGHCEYFAGAMVRVMQSVGLQARMVVGFRCEEYNSLGGYYIVRQSNAHAWVEVLTENGWQRYDPTTSTRFAQTDNTSVWTRIQHFFHYLQFRYATSVVAYNSNSQESIVQGLQTQLNRGANARQEIFSGTTHWMQSTAFWSTSSQVLFILVAVMIVGLVIAIIVLIYQAYRLRQRAKRMGMSALPAREQIRLARELGFYDDLIQLLEKHNIERPPHLTPMEFAESLWQLPTEVYDSIIRMTKLFYRVRYGDRSFQAAQRRRLQQVVERIDETLNARAGFTVR